MKKALLFFWLLIAASSASGQTITWDGSASNLWNNPANWDLNTLPTSAHDVLIPTGSTVNLNVGVTVNSIWIQGTTTFSINGSLGFSNPSTFDGGANINWVSGAISTGSTLANYGIINLLSTNNKQVVGGGMINNFGTINVPDSGDLYLTDATLNNQVSGIIDMQADAGNLSWSSGGAHILNNLGLIKRTSSAGTATIECQLNNSGTISVESGTLQFTTYTMMLDSGIYNVAAGTTLHWSGPQSLSGMLTGVVDGQILWTGTVSVATTQNADLNFSGSGTVNWSNGSLAGGGSLSNYSPIQVSTTTNKTIIGATTLNNHDVISIVDSGDIYITDGVINNHVAGTINLTAAAGNLSWSSGGTHTLNNYGIIRKLGDTGLNAIDCQMNNFGTIEVLAGNLGLTYGGINLNGGVYNISANSFLSISALTNMTGQLSGTIAGEILWTSTVNVPSSEVATFAFTGVGSGNVNWQNGVLSGGGVLVNNFTMRLSSTANKQIIGLTTLQNLALIYIQTSGDLYITDGIVNNMLTGIIDMRADAGDLSWSSGGSHLLNNYGLIKRTTTSGVATIECELHNFGTLSVQNGTMQLQGLPKTLSGGTYNVTAGTFLDFAGVINCNGTLIGNVAGQIRWTGSVVVATEATFDFSGAGAVVWSNGALNGGGLLTNSFLINLDSTTNKQIIGATTLVNDGMIAIVASGDLYITSGTLNNLVTGIIDLRADAGNLSYSSGGPNALNNSGLIKRTTTSGTASIECALTNLGTISVESGTLSIGGLPVLLNGGIYNVSPVAILLWQSPINFTATLAGQVDGQIHWTSTAVVDSGANFDFTGAGAINWSNGALSGGGVLTNNFIINLSSTTNKQIIGNTVLNNNGQLLFVNSGDLYITDGTVNNLAPGIIDFTVDAAYISWSSGGAHILNNYGLVKKSAGAGTSGIQTATTNYGTIDVQSGIINIDSLPFVNHQLGTMMGTGTFGLPGGSLFTNDGTFAPGGSPGMLTISGSYNSSSSSMIDVELNGLTAGTGYDVMNITGNAIFNGGIEIDLGFAPAIGDMFSIVSIVGNITTCGLDATETAVRASLEYTFSVACVSNDNVVLTVIEIQAVPPTASSQTFCNGATVADLEAEGSNLQWYSSQTGGSPLAPGTVLSTGTYYASQTVSGFESDRTPVQVTVNTTPAPAASAQYFNQGATVSDLSATGTNLQWYSQSVGGSPLPMSTPLASGTYYVSQTMNGCESTRTAVPVTINNAEGMFYVDADDDGFGTGPLVSVPSEDPTAPEGYSLNNTDCNDNNAAIYQSASLFVDGDGDGYDDGSETVCYGSSIPTGYSDATLGSDCDDSDADTFTSYPFYTDADGDSYGTGSAVMVCTSDANTAPAGYSLNNTDCDDTDADSFNSYPFYTDADGDSYGTGSAMMVCTSDANTAPDGYSVNNTDCDDTDADAFTSYPFYSDADGDSYGTGSSVMVCTSDANTAPAGYSTNNTDCDDTDASSFAGHPYFVDADGDSYGTGSPVMVCTSDPNTAPTGYSLNNTDCNDNLPAAFQSAQLFIDNDGDGYDNGSEEVCYGNDIPDGYASSTLGADCDDNNANNFTGYPFYTDADGDSYGTGTPMMVCTNDPNTAPAGYSLNNTDCDDTDEQAYQSAVLFIDDDGDGFDNGTATICYGQSVPDGYSSTTNGADCDDSNANTSAGYTFYEDADGDNFGTGDGEMICTDDPTTAPDGYSLNNTDCDDDDANVNPGNSEVYYNGIDDNCDGQIDEGNQMVTSIIAAQCGSTVASMGSSIYANSINDATAYRFEITNLSNNTIQILERPVRWFTLTMLPSHDYATTYSVRVQIQRNGIWLGYYGPSCLISSPAILAPDGAAQVNEAQCGSTLAAISTIIMTNNIANATGYRFRITNLTDPSAPNAVQTIDRGLRWFSLTMLPTYNYGTTYMIEVAVKTTGDYSGFGSACEISTPAIATINNCGQTVANAGTIISTISYNKATSYRFELTDLSTGMMMTIDRPLQWFKFNMLQSYTPNASYSIRVAVMTTGHYSPFGPSCTITSPGNLSAHAALAKVEKVEFKVLASPNPYTDVFFIKVVSDSDEPVRLQVYDMVGKLLQVREVASTDLELLEIGQNYPSGVYNVVVSQGMDVKTLRVIKR